MENSKMCVFIDVNGVGVLAGCYEFDGIIEHFTGDKTICFMDGTEIDIDKNMIREEDGDCVSYYDDTIRITLEPLEE